MDKAEKPFMALSWVSPTSSCFIVPFFTNAFGILSYTKYFTYYRAGGWILDNFPQNREQWSLMQEKNILPDDVVFLKDTSEGGMSVNNLSFHSFKNMINRKR